MNVAKEHHSGYRPGAVTFFVGLGLIASATVLNIALDRMSKSDLDTLPSFIGNLYEHYGKVGVTVLFVSTGLVVLFLGEICRGWFGRVRRSMYREPRPIGQPLGNPYARAEAAPQGSQGT